MAHSPIKTRGSVAQRQEAQTSRDLSEPVLGSGVFTASEMMSVFAPRTSYCIHSVTVVRMC